MQKNDSVWIRVKRCNKCQRIISLGEGESLHAYTQHQAGGKCADLVKKQEGSKEQPKLSDFWRKKEVPMVPPLVSNESEWKLNW